MAICARENTHSDEMDGSHSSISGQMANVGITLVYLPKS